VPLLRRIITGRKTRLVFSAAVVVFLAANLITYGFYHSRTYPATSIAGHRIGSVARQALPQVISKLPLLPKEVAFTQSKTSITIPVSDLDITVDSVATAEQTMQSHHWLPVANFFVRPTTSTILKDNPAKLQQTLQNRLQAINQPAGDAKIIKQDTTLIIKPETNGQSLNSEVTADRLRSALGKGRTSITVATRTLTPHVTAQSLRPQFEDLQKQLKTTIKLQYQSKAYQYTTVDLLGLYIENGTSLSLSDSAIRSSVLSAGSGFGISLQNLDTAAGAIKNALTSQKDLTFILEARPYAKIFNYCTAVRGVSDSELPSLAQTLQKTYNDSRGWNVGGLIKFQAASPGSSCDFTVWLASAEQMASFGAICDSLWSCTVPPNVIINYDRWRNTTTSWQASSGSLEDYRAMVINHETGHELGFGHDVCPAAGQPAPVMQQQSINLQGCVFNPWPTAREQAVLKQRLGI
jgi:hypothetical protein